MNVGTSPTVPDYILPHHRKAFSFFFSATYLGFLPASKAPQQASTSWMWVRIPAFPGNHSQMTTLAP